METRKFDFLFKINFYLCRISPHKEITVASSVLVLSSKWCMDVEGWTKIVIWMGSRTVVLSGSETVVLSGFKNRCFEWVLNRYFEWILNRCLEWAFNRCFEWVLDHCFEWVLDHCFEWVLDHCFEWVLDHCFEWVLDHCFEWVLDHCFEWVRNFFKWVRKLNFELVHDFQMGLQHIIRIRVKLLFSFTISYTVTLNTLFLPSPFYLDIFRTFLLILFEFISFNPFSVEFSFYLHSSHVSILAMLTQHIFLKPSVFNTQLIHFFV